MSFRFRHTYPLFRRVALLSLALVLLAGLPAAAQEPPKLSFPPSEGTTWGEAADLGDGQIQTFITLDQNGNPSLLGVYFTESALSNLPETPSDGQWDIVDASGTVIMPCCGHELALKFPEEADSTLFKHFVANWNPTGHVPPGVYDVPHFDFHFYLITEEEREAIAPATAETMCSVPNPPDAGGGEHPVPVTCETFEQGMIPLPDDQMPPGYLLVDAVEPRMGNHMINTQAPELAGEPFTHTWIYGAFGGRVTFFEPMITLAFLEERNEEVCTPIAVPEAMPEPGFYPTEYCIRYLAGDDEGSGAFVVSLEKFVEYN